VEQKNRHVVHQTVGYHRYVTPAELKLHNRIWAPQRLLTNYFLPHVQLGQRGCPSQTRSLSRAAATSRARAGVQQHAQRFLLI
jgi:hypothetical protein